jgi:hypothetical protein
LERGEIETTIIGDWKRDRLNNNSFIIGMFRNIYPYNIINNKHLENTVEGKKMSEWIYDSEKRGNLSELNENLYLWTIKESNLLYVRDHIAKENLLICYHPQVIPSYSKI